MKGVKDNKIGVYEDADYELEDPNGLLGTSNAIPLPFNVQGPRIFYGDRFSQQALSLKNREAPLVRNKSNQANRSWDRVYGPQMGSIFSKKGGQVTNVSERQIEFQTDDGEKVVEELYENHPFNRNTYITQTSSVKPGDRIKEGDLLATSNYTDQEGRMAVGLNARMAVVPFKGYSMDDATVISQSLANRLTSNHSEKVVHENDSDVKMSKNHFVSLFPKKFNKRQLDSTTNDGVVRPGTVLEPGDPIFLKTQPRSFSSGTDASSLSRAKQFSRKDSSTVWEGNGPAVVKDVTKNRKGNVNVLLQHEDPVSPGDKLVLRAGQKSTVSKIIPDDQMPRGEDGQPMEILFNQLGLPSRENFSTYAEMLLGKVAAKNGKPYVLPSSLPEGTSWQNFVKEELDRNGVQVTEQIYDPVTDSYLDNKVATGVGHILKLNHQASKKISHRGQGAYDLNRQPVKGGGRGGGAQRLSGLEMDVLHSSGARGVQQGSLALRGEFRDDYWRALKENRPLPKLGKPFVWDKFQALLNGSGVNAKDLGKGRLRLVPMTDKELDRRKAVPIEHGGIVDLKTMAPKKGGLFDPFLTRNQQWGYIDLPRPVVNPAYENQVRTLLGLTQKEYQDLIDK